MIIVNFQDGRLISRRGYTQVGCGAEEVEPGEKRVALLQEQLNETVAIKGLEVETDLSEIDTSRSS